MEYTDIMLRCIYSTRSLLVLTALLTQLGRPLGMNAICESNDSQFSMTDMQTQLCVRYPELVTLLMTDVVKVFQHHCHHQFQYERWDCTNVNLPIFGAKSSPFLMLQTKEAAFVYALASAAVVHTVADQCVKYANKLHYCRCDKSLKDEALATGEKWAGCSPDIHFSISFTKAFVDRGAGGATLEQQAFVLHNNKIGRLTVMDYMYKSCTCLVNSPKHYCFYQKVCKLKLPTMNEVAIKLKMKYEQSTHSMILPSSGQRHPLVVDRENQRRVHPERMIYFSRSPDYCAANPAYNISGIAGRECILNDPSLSHHCDNLCCDHGYETHSYRTYRSCECKFIWCCSTVCKVCYKTETKNRCKNKSDISPTD